MIAIVAADVIELAIRDATSAAIDFQPNAPDEGVPAALIPGLVERRSPRLRLQPSGVPVGKCHTIMEKYGYTGSACIPMALDDAIELGKI
jgi:hypothetical protein